MSGRLGAIWGIVGITLVLGRGFYSVWPPAAALDFAALAPVHWAGLVVSLAFMGYAKGCRTFQFKVAPRIAARALYLTTNVTPLRAILAPFFCMGYFHAPRKRVITSYAITTMIVLFIIGVRRLPQPWRGIIDAGVLLGLGWGLIAIWIFCAKAFWGRGEYAVPPETP